MTIQTMLDKGMILVSWQGRYGGETYVCVGPFGYASQFSDIECGGDFQSGGLTTFLCNEGCWLPTAAGKDFCKSVVALEYKLSLIPKEVEELWLSDVAEAYECIYVVDDAAYGIEYAVRAKNSRLMGSVELQALREMILDQYLSFKNSLRSK